MIRINGGGVSRQSLYVAKCVMLLRCGHGLGVEIMGCCPLSAEYRAGRSRRGRQVNDARRHVMWGLYMSCMHDKHASEI